MAEPGLRLLLVCLGNICRSPMAEGAMRARIAQAGLGSTVTIDSAGTADWHAGRPPDPRAVATAHRHGVDISGLRARPLRLHDFGAFDWLLCADADNLADLRARAPAGASARTALLLDWAGLHGPIADPYSGGLDDFERTWGQVDAAAQALVARLRSSGGAG